MEPVSGMISGAIPSPSTAADIKAPPRVQRPEEQTRGGPKVPARDEYVPEEKQEPSGRYWLGQDEDGQPKVYFDAPERAADGPEQRDGLPDAGGPGKNKGADERKASGDKAEKCTGNTDRVDREIEKLKRKREELERQIDSETDAAKIEGLKKKLAQVEGELRQKDNDAYRRQHAVFS